MDEYDEFNAICSLETLHDSMDAMSIHSSVMAVEAHRMKVAGFCPTLYEVMRNLEKLVVETETVLLTEIDNFYKERKNG